jgi:exodeoxyribonuclease VII small subunit
VSKKAKETGFESALAELEKLVALMEAGDMPLEQALRSFERGVQLTRECQTALQSAQQKVQILLQKPSGAVITDFANDDDSEDPSPI